MNLSDIVALVTGGTGALGPSVVDSLASHGARVIAASRSGKRINNATSLIADVTVEEDVVGLFREVRERFGEIRILVNLAGGYLQGRLIQETDVADFDQMMSQNLRSAFFCSREFMRNRLSDGYGRIINIAARPAVEPSAGKGAYAISKAGLVALTKMMAEETRDKGTTVNAIVPGIIKTPSNVRSMPDADQRNWVAPEEIASLILHLCSEHGKSITGACIPMYGGN
jgi:NAD(P)-dependent dehydrogenase (short-subunit alcohol dehydrogenase family)